MIKGIILDFNGSMYLDHDLNYEAWKETYNEIKGNLEGLDYDDFKENVETLTKDYDYVKFILESFKLEVNDEIINKYIVDKELRYQNKAKQQNRTELIEGLPKFLDYLKENKIPFCIASMAPKMNFEFYMDHLNLKKWFNWDNIVYDCELWPSKKEMYIEACKRMKIDIFEALLFEDSPKMIDIAADTGIKNLVYVNTKNKELHLDIVKQEILNYEEFDYSILNSFFFGFE